MLLETDIAPDLLPPARLPAVNLELLGIERRLGQRGVGRQRLVRRNILGKQLELVVLAFRRRRQTIDGETQVRQHFVIDDVIEENGIRVEGFFRQDDALIKGFVAANGSGPEKN